MSLGVGLYLEKRGDKVEIGEFSLSGGEPTILTSFDSSGLVSALAFVEEQQRELPYEVFYLKGFSK